MKYSIPSRLNIFIIAVCTIAFITLFIAGTHFHQLWIRLFLGLAFGIVMIPVYSLMHEAAHNILNPSDAVNSFLGRWLCCLFIISFTFYRHCHLKHHKKNRTDAEMWDLYYEHQDKRLRYGNLYLMMIGFGYLATWLSVLLLSVSPSLITSSVFKKHNETNGFVEGFTMINKLRTAQIESIIVIIFQILLLWFINWDLTLWFTFYLIHGFVWSSQNYVNHAFSPRTIINGAHNLKIPALFKPLYLNFNIHLAHHQNPGVPWLHLRHYIKKGENRISFLKNYLRLWKGPRLTHEENPFKDDEISAKT